MEKQFANSNWFGVEKVPDTYIFPEEDRPAQSIPICYSIPVIGLNENAMGAQRIRTIQQIVNAAQEFHVFQVSADEVSFDIISETMKLFKEFFELPEDEKDDIRIESGCVYASGHSSVTWRDSIKHPCYPLDQCIPCWPKTPTRYREVMVRYLAEMRRLGLKILELIGEGLGLEAGYLCEISEVQIVTGNRYPPCPDPSLTFGIARHQDPSLITLLYQGDVCGLQVCKDGKWMGVEAKPSAFVVLLGNQLEIISNGKLKGTEHRAVTNPSEMRISIATLVNPSPNCIIQPAKALVDDDLNPPHYQPTLYKDFVYKTKGFGPHTVAMQNYIKSDE